MESTKPKKAGYGFAQKCAICDGPIKSGNFKKLWDEKIVHIDCFRCKECKTVLDISSVVREKLDGFFCPGCHFKLFSQRCAHCKDTIEPDEQIFVNQKYLHHSCFRCDECQKTLCPGRQFQIHGHAFCDQKCASEALNKKKIPVKPKEDNKQD